METWTYLQNAVKDFVSLKTKHKNHDASSVEIIFLCYSNSQIGKGDTWRQCAFFIFGSGVTVTSLRMFTAELEF